MALSIVTQPPSIALANSPLIYDLYSTDNTRNNFKYTLEFKAWTGLSSAVPSSPTYTLSKAPNSAGKGVFDVSRLAREFIELTMPNDLTSDTNNSVNDVIWIRATAKTSWDGGSDTAVNSATTLATLGYSKYNDGIINNTHQGEPIQQFLTIHSTGVLSIPMWNGIVDQLTVRDEIGGLKDFPLTFNTNSNQQLKYIDLSLSKFGTYGLSTTGRLTLDYKLSGGVVYKQYVDIICEPKYTPYQLIFMNSMGVWEYMTFFKSSTTTAEAQRTTYYNTNVSYGNSTTAISYDTSKGARTAFLSNAYLTHVLNTGYVRESESERIQQLLVSDHVIMYDNSKYVAVEITSNSQTLRTHVNDKTINYTIGVKETAGVINKVY